MNEHLQDHLVAIIQSADDAIISKSMDGIILFWNKGAERILGYTSEEMLGKSINILVPNKIDEHQSILEKFDKGEKLEHFETKRIKKDGSLIDMSIMISPIYDKQKNAIGFFTIARDISKIKKSDDKFRGLLESAPDAMVIVNSEGKIQLVNSQTEKIFGYNREEIVGKEVEILIPARFKDAHPGHRAGFFSNPKARSMGVGLNLFGKHKNGNEFPVEISLSPLKTEEGVLVSAAIRDVTTQKKANEELLKSNERFFKVFDNNPIGMIITHLETTKFQFVNKMFVSNFGYTKEEIIGKTSLELSLIDAESRQKIRSLLHHGDVKDVEILVRKKNGETFWSLTSIEIIIIGGEKFALNSFHNITERKKTEAIIEQKTKELINSNQELEQFAYVASHDLQEPLRTIHNFTGLIEKQYYGKLDAETDQYLYFILNAVSKMQNLIKDLLEFSRVGRNIVLVNVDCNTVLKEVMTEMKASIEEKNVRMTSAILPTLKGCEIELKRLFQNLIGNAIKFHKNGITPEISIQVEQKDTEYIFSVKDNGIGIEKEYTNKLFIIFQRLNDNSQYPGTGIGLAICKKIVTLHGGKIWVRSKLGEGSIFYFSISKKI